MAFRLSKKLRGYVDSCMSMYTYIKPYKWRALIAVFASIPASMLDMAIPVALRSYIDGIISPNSSPFVQLMPIVVIVFTLVQSASTYLNNYMNAWVGAKISNGLKYDLFKKLMRYEASYFDRNASGMIQMRYNGDVDMACAGLLNNTKSFIKKFFNIVGYVGFLIYVSWQLSIVAICVLVLALLPLGKIRGRISELSGQSIKTSASVSTHYIEAFGGNRVITSYNLYDIKLQDFKQSLENVFVVMMRMVKRTGILSPAMHFIIGSGIAVILFYGNWLIQHGSITAGDFTSFITSVILLYQPIKTMGDEVVSVQNSFLAMDRVFSLLEDTPEISNCAQACLLDRPIESIRYDNVSFEYSEGKQVLHNIDLLINAGQTVAFVGNSGGGKSTLVNLLPRFYDVSSGAVRINDVDIREYDMDSLRANIAVVFQDNFLFGGTIRDNIMLGKPDATKEELHMAVKSACLEEFVASLKMGLDTHVGERGVLLSGGQKQRIAIARALIKNAPVVVLDEATSALDNKSEKIVQQALDNLMQNRTVLVIAHRLSTVRHADKIVVIDHGRIAEIGSHDELLARENSVYASLYKTQLQ